MGILPYETLQKAWEIVRALSHTTRIDILKHIEQEDAPNVTNIYCALRIDQGTASQHLAVLHGIGAVKRERQGKSQCYSINWDWLNNVAYNLRIMSYIWTGLNMSKLPTDRAEGNASLDNVQLWARKAFNLIRALRNDVRLSILQKIYINQSMKVSDLYLNENIQQSLISQHLAILRNNQKPDSIFKPCFVKVKRTGRRLYYSLNNDYLNKVQNYITDISNLYDPPKALKTEVTQVEHV
jgi:DNA-binding transcriptional ArsR family regulator